MDYFNSLPSEITLDILSRVPTESVLECKSVCTNWNNIVSHHPSFSKMHSKHHAGDSGKLGFIALTMSSDLKNRNFQYFEYSENHESTAPIERIRRLNFNPPFGEDTTLLGSCNGVICLARFRYLPEKTYICNPVTREYIMLPEIKRVKREYGGSGFGYVSSTNEYKVVRMISETEINEVYIYTLGSGLGWRNLGNFNFGTRGQWNEGVFVNGAIYWVEFGSQMIIHFDLAEEKFCEHLPFPLPIDNDCNDWYKLGVLDGCLSFAVNYTPYHGTEYWDAWLLKKKIDHHCMKDQEEHQALDWSEEFRVYDKEIFAVTKSYAVLTFNGNHIDIHDLEASTSKRIIDFKEYFSEAIPHRNTLFSLKEFEEEDTKIMMPVEIGETD